MKSMQQLFSRENLKTFLIWNVGAFITAVGAYFFKYPNHFSFGGVSGITVVLGHYFPELSLGGINWVLNLALLVLGAVMLGKSFGVSTAYVTVSMSAFLSLFEVLFPMSQPLTDQPLLELIFGVLLPSVGAAVLFNVGASTGGTDIIAMILKKYTSADIGSAPVPGGLLHRRRCLPGLRRHHRTVLPAGSGYQEPDRQLRDGEHEPEQVLHHHHR